MEENNKVIVFEKKEIVLVLIFVVVLIITSFTLGIRLGKKLGMADAGVTESDKEKITNLKSGLEEDVEKTVEEDSKLTDEEKLRKLMDEQQNLLKDNLEKVSSDEPAMSTNQSVEPKSSNAMTGKFTIQLGSYPSLDEAKQFAEGFSVRGYSPIINESQIAGKGTWYRVSLGLFNSVDEAKTYIKGEQSLFSGQDYVITEIK